LRTVVTLMNPIDTRATGCWTLELRMSEDGGQICYYNISDVLLALKAECGEIPSYGTAGSVSAWSLVVSSAPAVRGHRSLRMVEIHCGGNAQKCSHEHSPRERSFIMLLTFVSCSVHHSIFAKAEETGCSLTSCSSSHNEGSYRAKSIHYWLCFICLLLADLLPSA
jgi:hypothetical protein